MCCLHQLSSATLIKNAAGLVLLSRDELSSAAQDGPSNGIKSDIRLAAQSMIHSGIRRLWRG
ncbi:hypothetical protein NXC24_PB00134 (plasmid) [Rhizobium sp. NXC24]|nr:hypothetical protein NXC24_PB00134 [Rhizobium sp. NXC24]